MMRHRSQVLLTTEKNESGFIESNDFTYFMTLMIFKRCVDTPDQKGSFSAL